MFRVQSGKTSSVARISRLLVQRCAALPQVAHFSTADDDSEGNSKTKADFDDIMKRIKRKTVLNQKQKKSGLKGRPVPFRSGSPTGSVHPAATVDNDEDDGDDESIFSSETVYADDMPSSKESRSGDSWSKLANPELEEDEVPLGKLGTGMSEEHMANLVKTGLFRMSSNGNLVFVVKNSNLLKMQMQEEFDLKVRPLLRKLEEAQASGDDTKSESLLDQIIQLEQRSIISNVPPPQFTKLERMRLKDPKAAVEFDYDIPEYRDPHPEAFNPRNRLDLRDPKQFYQAVKEVLSDSPNALAMADYDFEDLPTEALDELNLLAEELMQWDESDHPLDVMKEANVTEPSSLYQIPEVERRNQLQKRLDKESFHDDAKLAASFNPQHELHVKYLKFIESRPEVITPPEKYYDTVEDAMDDAIKAVEEDIEARLAASLRQEEKVLNNEEAVNRLAEIMAKAVIMSMDQKSVGPDVTSPNAFKEGRFKDSFVIPQTRSENDEEYMEMKGQVFSGERDWIDEHVQIHPEEAEERATGAFEEMPKDIRLIRMDPQLNLKETAPFLVEDSPGDSVVDEPWEILKKRLLSKKGCPICLGRSCKPLVPIDYTNIRLLNEFISPAGSIIAKRFTGVCAKRQRQISRAIKLSRSMGLMPYFAKWDFRPFDPVLDIVKLDPRHEYNAEGVVNLSSELNSDQDSRFAQERLEQLEKMG